jgi:hypothetical protein
MFYLSHFRIDPVHFLVWYFSIKGAVCKKKTRHYFADKWGSMKPLHEWADGEWSAQSLLKSIGVLKFWGCSWSSKLNVNKLCWSLLTSFRFSVRAVPNTESCRGKYHRSKTDRSHDSFTITFVNHSHADYWWFNCARELRSVISYVRWA